MHINIAKPQHSREELSQALYSELRSGVMAKAALEKIREVKAAQEAQEIKKHEPFAFKNMKCVAVMPGWEWFNLRKKYGAEAMNNREFIRDFQKKFPHLAPNKIA